MATISNTPRPGYVYDSTDAVWYPIGTGTHSHSEIASTIVDAKGDIIAASAADTPARLAVGNNGETLVADSSTATGLSYQADFAAGKNKIINGGFGVWQRGTSFSGLGDGAFFADRFAIAFLAGGASNTASQQTFTPGAAPVAGYEAQFFGRVAATSGSGSTILGISQKIEDVRTLAGQTFTFSFYAKADSARTVTSYRIQSFGSGGSANVSNSTTFALTTSWARYSYTATMPSVSGKTIGAGSYLYINLELAAGQASGSPVLDTWGWQLEAGSVPTAFQTATGTLQGELAACQRYYQKSYNQATTPGTDITGSYSGAVIFGGWGSTSAAKVIQYPHQIPMRTTPTISFWDLGGNASKITTFDTGFSRTNNVAASGGTIISENNHSVNPGTSTINGWSWCYAASAEL